MSKRLIKVAKELNVGVSTIVEHLSKNGIEIESKPTSKISEEMEAILLKEFSSSLAIKEEADKIIIGTRPATAKTETETPASEKPAPVSLRKEVEKPKISLRDKPATEAPEPEKPVEKPVEEVVEETPVVETKEETKEEAKPKVGLKVLGKIDLNKPKKTKKKETPKEEPPAKPPKKEEVAEKVEKAPKDKPKAEETPKEATEKPKDSGDASTDENVPPAMVRAATPELRGLKIQGKIDVDKLKKPAKKKAETKNEKAGAKTGEKAKSSDDNKRRRRRRTVRTTTTPGGNQRRRQQGSGGRNQRPKRAEPKEISQKEVDEKIKATMARLQGGGGKKKRQRLRREHRERVRDKQEMLEQNQENDKLELTEFISVSELANLMDVSVADVITVCMNLGVIVSINQRLDAEIIELVAGEFDHEVEFISAEDQLDEDEEIVDAEEDLKPRAPIVTVMGHVDHGKTSLLDYIRSANVAEGEAGGITQHIGAYEVEAGSTNKKITFLDTPGHEAFTAMRARGAKVTDIAIIIISADDRVMPQTKEAISHAQAAGVPIVFAINKIDKAGANPQRIKEELSQMNLLIEEWGGNIQSQDISAKTGENIDLLLEKVILEAEMLNLKANPDREATGSVVEASLDKGRGYVTNILVTNGTLEVGDAVVAGEHSGRVKAMFDEKGKKVKKAGPSKPVLLLGLSGAPQAGEKFKVTESDREARQLAAKRGQINREQTNRAAKRLSLDEIGRRLALGSFKELNLIVKGDVDGSIEALSDSLIKLSQETVQVNIIHKAVGQIIESDVLLASASDAIIIGFQVRPSLAARRLAEKEGVEIKTYSIIYETIDEIKAAIEGLLEPTKEEKITSQVTVRNIFKISKVGTIAGCMVDEGKITRNSLIRIIREGIVIYPTKQGAVGELASLKRFKDDAKEVKAGLECGLNIKNFNDIKVGDVIESYEIHEIKQTLK